MPSGRGDDPVDRALSEARSVAAEWCRVLVENVPADVGRFMTDDWVYVDSAGFATKAEVIGWIRDGRLAHHSMELVGEAIARRVGDTVLVTGRKRSTGTWDGVPYAADEWITEVYVYTEGSWRCAFSQKTDVAPGAG